MTSTEAKDWLTQRGFKSKKDLKMLLPSIAQPWIKTTAMFEAAKEGNLAVCKFIVRNGAGNTGAACQVVSSRLWFEYNCSSVCLVRVRSNFGKTPFLIACYGGHLDVAKWLFSVGANEDVR
jgi:hypothetical protein